jgi:hypothetical protein
MSIQAGRYRGFLENPELAESAKKGTPCVKATARVADPSAGDSNNSRIEWEGWLTDNTAERTIQSLIYAGCTFPSRPGEEDANLEDFTGCGLKEVELQIEIEEYTPEPSAENPNPRTTKRPRIAFVNRIGESRATKAIDANQKRMIAKNFGALIGKVRAGTSSSVAKAGDAGFDPKAIEAEAAKKKLY